MSMLHMLEKEMSSRGVFEGNLPDIADAIANTIPATTIPYRMKLALAMSEIVTFASQFRINILHWNSSSIPINAITFCIAKSGLAKDSSLKAVRKCFNTGYTKLNDKRKSYAISQAINLAKQEELEEPESFSTYKKFYQAPSPLFLAVPTKEGFIQHLNDLETIPLGSGYIYAGEVGDELSTNPSMPEIVTLCSELYDEGSKEIKIIKDRERQLKEVKNFPVSALFQTSPDIVLYNKNCKTIFKTNFTSKLARRSFFIFVSEDIPNIEYSSIEELENEERKREDKCISLRSQVNEFISEITDDLLKRNISYLKVSNEVRDLFNVYKRYNEELAETIDTQHPIAKLSRAHIQWKALKLSGALALLETSDTILLSHYKAAIEFCELIADDIGNFEIELVKEPYELFTTYARKYAINHEFKISIHQLRKLGFVPTNTGLVSTQLSELSKLANSCDEHGSYTVDGDCIVFNEIEVKDTIKVSYLYVTGTKQYRAINCAKGYQCRETTFADLYELLQDDYAYSPFEFANGIRSKDNIISGCKWIVLDIDTIEISDEEAHFLLSDINHFIARTSNPNNPYKYRVLLELDAEVNIPDRNWIKFIKAITSDLGFTCDSVPKSQIFFSYKDREILATLDVNPLPVKEYYNIAMTELFKKPNVLSKKAMNALLDDPYNTFELAFNAENGSGSRRIIWACKRARELGANKEYCHTLIDQITSYWTQGFEQDRLEKIHNQIDRWEF